MIKGLDHGLEAGALWETRNERGQRGKDEGDVAGWADAKSTGFGISIEEPCSGPSFWPTSTTTRSNDTQRRPGEKRRIAGKSVQDVGIWSRQLTLCMRCIYIFTRHGMAFFWTDGGSGLCGFWNRRLRFVRMLFTRVYNTNQLRGYTLALRQEHNEAPVCPLRVMIQVSILVLLQVTYVQQL